MITGSERGSSPGPAETCKHTEPYASLRLHFPAGSAFLLDLGCANASLAKICKGCIQSAQQSNTLASGGSPDLFHRSEICNNKSHEQHLLHYVCGCIIVKRNSDECLYNQSNYSSLLYVNIPNHHAVFTLNMIHFYFLAFHALFQGESIFNYFL